MHEEVIPNEQRHDGLNWAEDYAQDNEYMAPEDW